MREVILALLLALSLCADCFAVSLCSGVTMKTTRRRQVLMVALVFGIVQAGLLLAGYFFGDLFVGYIEKFAHWIGFLLLLYVGGSMILEAIKGKDEARDLNGIRNIIVASVATSIDALIVGVTIGLENNPILWSASIIGVVTFIDCFICSKLGAKLGEKFGSKLLIVGGLVLIGIGIKVLISDLFF
jgi:putative Mn2+ efflux pump MntP